MEIIQELLTHFNPTDRDEEALIKTNLSPTLNLHTCIENAAVQF